MTNKRIYYEGESSSKTTRFLNKQFLDVQFHKVIIVSEFSTKNSVNIAEWNTHNEYGDFVQFVSRRLTP